jgi:hypothetical protein
VSVPKSLGLGALISGVAALCYVPWALYVEATPSGYAGLLEYQSGYVGPSVLVNFAAHAKLQHFLDGFWSRVALPAAYLVSIAGRSALGLRRREFLLTLAGLSLAGILLGTAVTTLVLAVLGIVHILACRTTFRRWLVLGLFGTFFVATPLYTSFARLALPLALGSFALAAVWMARAPTPPTAAGRGVSLAESSAWVAAAAAVLFAVSLVKPSGGNPWHSGTQMEDAVTAIRKDIGAEARVAVFGEPAAAYYFKESGVHAFPTFVGSSFATPREAEYLVAGRYSRRLPSMVEQLASLGDRIEKLGSYAVRPSDLRLLDDMKPGRARRYRREPDSGFDLDLFRLHPVEPDASAPPQS